MIDLEEAARQADADAEYDRKDAETRRETPRTPWVRLHDTTIEELGGVAWT
jgi:citrate lyase beta subunit